MECCRHVMVDASSCYMNILDKLGKKEFRAAGPSLAFSLEPLVHRRNSNSLVDVHLNCLNLLHFLDVKTASTRFFHKKNFFKKMSLKNPKTLRKC